MATALATPMISLYHVALFNFLYSICYFMNSFTGMWVYCVSLCCRLPEGGDFISLTAVVAPVPSFMSGTRWFLKCLWTECINNGDRSDWELRASSQGRDTCVHPFWKGVLGHLGHLRNFRINFTKA